MATLVSVSQNAVTQAESAILACSHCARGARTPFWQILDAFRPNQEGDVAYILPVLGSCPKCRAPIDETTLVQPKPGHQPADSALKKSGHHTSVPA
jgi:hypothetical protein